MAKLSSVVKNNKRKALSKKFESKRAALRKVIASDNEWDEKLEAMKKLQKMPRDTSRIRVRNRCELTGRPRAVYRDFQLCRIKFRELAHQGLIPGVTKASW